MVQDQERAAEDVGNVAEVVDAGPIIGVFLGQFTGPVGCSEGINDHQQGMLLFNPAGQLGELRELPFRFDLDNAAIEAIVVGISQ